jgi:hypothetical protein
MQRHVAQCAVVRYGVAAICVTATVIVALWLRPVVLAAAQLLLEGHGGRLWATPNATHGATFHFVLPGMR